MVLGIGIHSHMEKYLTKLLDKNLKNYDQSLISLKCFFSILALFFTGEYWGGVLSVIQFHYFILFFFLVLCELFGHFASIGHLTNTAVTS